LSDKTEIIILRESVIGSLIKDLGTVVVFLVLIGFGVYMQSCAMQWTGAIIGWVVVSSMATRIHKGYMKFTIVDARKRLDEMEAGND